MRGRSPKPSSGRPPILIVSASMGAGHDGAARNLAESLRAAGETAVVEDFLRSGPLRIGFALRRGYEFELRHVPSAYDATYRFWYRVPWLCPFIAWIVTVLTRRRLLRWVRDSGAAAVVSTYPLSTLCLGRLRQTGRLQVPAVNFITDFGVHPLWVHKGVDLNLAIHAAPAEVASLRTGRPALACGPVVSPRFDPSALPSRDGARARFGIGPDERAVLVVAGSWGIGNITATWEAIADGRQFTPVVVCGRDEGLRRHVTDLAARKGARSIVLGWTDDMPALMAACDALVENAGGLTSLEAMRAGLPVVSFDPIAGHGRENTAAMDAAGVGRLAASPAALRQILSSVTEPGPAQAAQVASAAALFRSDAAAIVLEVAARGAQPVPRPRRRPVRVAVATVGFAAACWAGLTTGVAMATEAGAGVTRPAQGSAAAYIGVRLTAAEAADPGIVASLRNLHASAVVDEGTAGEVPFAVRSLATAGVTVAAGGAGDGPGASNDERPPWTRAWFDARAAQAISGLAGEPVTVSVPGRRLDAWDLIECRNAHMTLVVPDHIFHVGDTGRQLSPGDVYLVNGLAATPPQLLEYLDDLSARAAATSVATAPLASL